MEIVINEVTYSLPCKSFLVDYSVSERRQLPVVKEFVVRFLFASESSTPDLLREYFGFTSHELDLVLEDLKEERLIEWEGQSVRLSRYAKQRFEEVEGRKIPRFFDVEDTIDSVSFDLFAYRLVSKRAEGEYSPANLEIKLPKGAYQNSISKAHRAFDDQFVSFLENVKRVDVFNESKELYKINHVAQKDDFLLPIKVRLRLDSESLARPSIEYADEWLEQWDDEQIILGEISKSLSGGIPVGSQGIAGEEYIRSVKDPLLEAWLSRDDLDLRAALSAFEKNRGVFDVDGRAIVGNFYTKENRQKLHSLLDQKYGAGNKVPAKGGIWSISTDRKIWGRTSDFEYFVQQIKSRYDSRYKPGDIALCLVANSRAEAIELERIYGRSGVALQGINAPCGNRQTEILLIPGVIVACLFHVERQDFGNQTIPIGYMSTNEKLVESVNGSISEWCDAASTFNDYFERLGVDDEKKVLNRCVRKILG